MTLLQPSVGLSDFWVGSGFEDKLLQAQGDFRSTQASAV